MMKAMSRVSRCTVCKCLLMYRTSYCVDLGENIIVGVCQVYEDITKHKYSYLKYDKQE